MVLSHKMVFIKNEAALLCVTMREREKFRFCGAFLNAFWHENEAFPKGSS